ncbi:MAG: hypothetical protein ACFFBD_28665 [Candidatus Hodarchaeota archaeon]
MARDKLYGYLIFIVTVLVMLFYIVWVPLDFLLREIFTPPNGVSQLLVDFIGLNIPFFKWELGVLLPVFLACMLAGIIVAWIGLTMATTPPPEPIDFDSLDLDDDEEEEEKTD